ncbi:PRC-barrel domain-containing protein [Streptomyces sp. VNUA74]|uniref:PRC-barrel domain-containing protein n=1 Tax=Streptomyces sp. VNUA74 TaxID=3062685 RepID=UPI00280AD853|nr:PRC-barrel domain-containing protein [Streptomyces sp. VNUA74]WML84458.1 PRC-barrel domain-containing protein [Streptomyces sp. VNUA74]
MMLFTEVRGLPVVPSAAGAGPLGTVASLDVDVAGRGVRHVRLRGGRLRRETALAWEAVEAIGPSSVRVRSTARPGPAPAGHDLLGHRVLTEGGTSHGTVLDVAFDPATGRLLAVFTTRGQVTPGRLMGLGDHALIVRTA